jgi:hypothetical protein
MSTRKHISSFVPARAGRLLGLLAFSSLLMGACATQQNVSAPLVKSADLVGTKWKLPFTENGIDGRTIEFKRGAGAYEGVLINVGRKLTDKVGAREGLVLMELVPDGPANAFKGFERIPGEDLAEVLCSVSKDGSAMKCNGQSTLWIRQL